MGHSKVIYRNTGPSYDNYRAQVNHPDGSVTVMTPKGTYEEAMAEARKLPRRNSAETHIGYPVVETLDEINPRHYMLPGLDGVEFWDVLKSLAVRRYGQDVGGKCFRFLLEASAMQYLSRCEEKNGSQDLRKAVRYIDRWIEEMGEIGK